MTRRPALADVTTGHARHLARLFVAVAACGALVATPAAAQEPDPVTKPAQVTPAEPPQEPEDPQEEPAKEPPARPASARRRPAAPPFTANVFFLGGYQGFAASQTFEATTGSAGGPIFGGGVSVTHRSGVFVQVDFSRYQADGERVFVHQGEAFPLGIPLTVRVMPLEVTAGYKFFVNRGRPPAATPPPPSRPAQPWWRPARPRAGDPGTEPPDEPEPEEPQPEPDDPAEAPPAQAEPRETPPVPPQPAPRARDRGRPPLGGLKPYVGGGVGRVAYRETSDFGDDADADESFTSYHVLGGLEFPVWRWLGAAAEFNFRWVRDAFGEGGASQAFGEDDLGGPSVRFKVTVGF